MGNAAHPMGNGVPSMGNAAHPMGNGAQAVGNAPTSSGTATRWVGDAAHSRDSAAHRSGRPVRAHPLALTTAASLSTQASVAASSSRFAPSSITMQRSLLLHGELPEPAPRPRWALAAKGFRPFFLLAALFASAIVPLWILVVAGVARPVAYLDATSWHAHEMVMGYAVAVLAGFLLTAVGNWTQRETIVGKPLLALSALWCLGRLTMGFAGNLPAGLSALADGAFLPALIVVLARPLIATKNRRNFVMLGILGALSVANVVVHLDALGLMAIGTARQACLVAVDLVVLVILVIAGRVFPMFTRNATGVASIRSSRPLDNLTIVGMVAITLVDALHPERIVAAVLSGTVGVLAIARAARWGTWHTGRHPLLWILHAGYGWLAFGLLLRGLSVVFHRIPASLATHALTVGAIGSLTLGMMARVALGHTGRMLVPPKPIPWAFGAITAAAFARVVVPLIVPAWYFASLVTAAGLWTVAFLVFLVSYGPVLVTPRVDGKVG